MSNTTQPEYLNNRITYQQRVNLAKKQVKQRRINHQLKEVYKFTCILSAMFVLLIICGLFN